MASVKPAWSAAFDSDTLQPMPEIRLPSPITREWAWGGSAATGVRVAVVDSGIDADHPMVNGVAGSVAFEEDAGSPEGVREVEGPHGDLFGHGTACAGIIRKLAPGAELHSVRVLGEQLSGKGRVLAAGIRWAIEHRMDVANLSLSSRSRDYFGLFHELADLAYFRRTMLVCAINNMPGPSYPSEYASVFSVAAHSGTDPARFDCNPNPPVEFGAPGIAVEVAWGGGTTAKMTGNSFAAPHIAGIIALILGKHPALTPFQVKTILAALANNATPATS
jgi:subtilisin